MDFDDVIRTTFAAREFTSDPVPDGDLYRILEQARFAPSGGNRQGWHVIVVREPAVRRRLAEIIQPVWRLYRAQVRAGENPFNTVVPSRVDREAALREPAPLPFVDHLHDLARIPVLLVITVDLAVVAAMDADLDRVGVVAGASIYPFVWSLLLSARNAGYGGVLTTFLAAGEAEAREALAIPDRHAVAAMVPLGRPVKQLTRLRRKPVESFTTLDRCDGPPFVPGSAGP
ncbi:MAG: nitroreductase family protein [Thermoanaerobaculia bacterium]|nr:nitroreductase family protein [Thermoanaerobaculia bacterium]